MNNLIQTLMQMVQGGANQQQMMSMFGQNPLFQQTMKMAQGKTPEEMQQLLQNIAQQKGMSMEQLKQFGQYFNIKF